MRFENRPLSQIRVGDSESLNRLVTTDDLYVFATASGNHNPMHLTQDDADHDGRPDAVAPGMFVASLISILSAVLGMLSFLFDPLVLFEPFDLAGTGYQQ